MNSDSNISCLDVGTDGRQFVTQRVGSDGKDFKEWLDEYMAMDANDLSKESKIIQAVISDEIDTGFVEQQIQESAPKTPVTKEFCVKSQDLSTIGLQ
jgi:hypothetical protein